MYDGHLNVRMSLFWPIGYVSPKMFAVLLSLEENIGFPSPVLFPLRVLKTFEFFPIVLVFSFEPT